MILTTLFEENLVDDVCFSPELDGNLGKPTVEDNIEEQDIQKGGSWDYGTAMNLSCEPNATAGNDSGSCGGWSDGTAAAAKPPDQDNPPWDVSAMVNNSTDAKQPGSWDVWNAPPPKDSSSTAKWNEGNDSGNKKGSKPDGWGAKTGNWRGERNNPGRPPRGPDPRGPPRKRFELTTEERNMLLQVEPIVRRVKRIFRDACEGVRLLPEDEKFIQERVLEHHPEKQSKVSGEIDHIMVDKHQNFQDTRCFFVVSTDGSRSDFSYLKCMENFVMKNYAEHADAFCVKYVRRPRRRQAPAAHGGTAPDTPAEAPRYTEAEIEQGTIAASPETQLGTPAPPAATTPQQTPASPEAPQQEHL